GGVSADCPRHRLDRGPSRTPDRHRCRLRLPPRARQPHPRIHVSTRSGRRHGQPADEQSRFALGRCADDRAQRTEALSEADSLREAVRVLRSELRIVNDRVAMAAGLKPRDLDILDVIDRDGPCTPSHLSERTGYHRATLTGILSRLVKDGWLVRDSNPEDGRSARLTPSDRFAELREFYAPVDEASSELA